MKNTVAVVITALFALTLTGCVTTSRSISAPPPPPMLSEVDRTLLVDCLGPVRLPAGAITQRDVERLWITDRKALIDCGKRHAALRDYYLERDAALRRGKP